MDGMSSLIGAGPAPGIAICNKWVANIDAGNAIIEKYKAKCK
jgi:hypothetical protein